jgi:Ran GTPase-activating protein (RanGAP) involved in mRNA processing and transport
LCNGVAQNAGLRRITVTHARLADDQAEKLVNAILLGGSPVAELNLSYNALGSPADCIEKLKRHTKLETLNLSGNALLCAETLAGSISGHWPALREVLLLRTQLSEEDAKVLKRAAHMGAERFAEYSTHARVVTI